MLEVGEVVSCERMAHRRYERREGKNNDDGDKIRECIRDNCLAIKIE